MPADPLDASLSLLRAALAGNVDQLETLTHHLATDALEDANEMEEAADDLGVIIQTLALTSAETLRVLASAIVHALAAAPAGSAIQVDVGSPVTITAASNPDQLVLDVAKTLRP